MPVSRVRPIAQRVVQRVFAVGHGTEIYACSRHSFAELGCVLQFTSRFGHVPCGNGWSAPRAGGIVVRYDAFNTRYGDF
jgi:hypothetical protein